MQRYYKPANKAKPAPPTLSPLERAKARQAQRTPEQIADIQRRWEERNKKYRKILQNEVRAKFAGTKVSTPIGDIVITNTSIKEFINQPHNQYREKNELAKKLDQVIKDASYIGYGEGKHKGQSKVHIFELFIQERPSWIIISEIEWGELKLHSISDSQSIKAYIKKNSDK